MINGSDYAPVECVNIPKILFQEKQYEKLSVDIEDYDVCVCGNDIVNIVLAAEKYSGFDTSEVRAEIEKKRVWLRDNEPDYYKECRLEDRDIFEQWIEKGYV